MIEDSRKAKDNEEDDEDLFGQGDDGEIVEHAGAVEQPDQPIKQEDIDDDDDLFCQRNGDDKLPMKSAVRIEDVELSTNGIKSENEPDIKTAEGIKVEEASAEHPMFELDTTPSDVPISAPVPRKRASSTSLRDPVAGARKSLTKESPTETAPSGLPTTLPANSSSSNKTPVILKGSTFGLSDEVIIPATLSSDLLEGRILASLKQLPSNLINDALQEYDDAITQKKRIRNHGAYLFGVLKRYLKVQERASGGCNGSMIMGTELTPEVQARLGGLVRDGFVTQEERDKKVKAKILMLSEEDALLAIDEFSMVDRGSIRNIGYFMGILNRYMRGEQNVNLGDRRVNNALERDDRARNDFGRSPDRRYNDRPRFGESRNNEYGRDRSRDRYDSHRNNSDRSNYDRQQQQPSHYGRQQLVPLPPPPPPRPQYGQQLQKHQPAIYQTPHQVQQPRRYQPPHQPNTLPHQGFQQGIPPISSNIQHQMQPHQPASNQFVQLPIVGQQPYAPAQIPPPQHRGAPVMNTVGVSNQMAHMQNHAMAALRPGYGGVPNPPSSNPLVLSWQQQQQRPGGAPDILGIAAKAAQALAASQHILQSNPRQAPVIQQPVVHQQYQAPQAQHQYPAQQHQQQPTPPQQYLQQQVPPQQHPPPIFRGRTVAKMHELPIAVQFAVQNLQTIGHINGPLDEGILGMIRDLPEPMALETIHRFVTLDTSNMRNKTAYLAGVLRRELERIHRR